MSADLHALVDRLAGKHILVVGDVILDEYLIGKAERLSREAPVPVLAFERRDLIPGGAANPAANITRLGSRAIQVGVVGDDENAPVLRDLLVSRGIDPAGLVSDPARPTTTKTRVMATMGLRFPQQVARLDRIARYPVNGAVEAAICERIRALGRESDLIIASDYLTGLLTPAVVSAIREAAGGGQPLPIVADAQGELGKYAGCTLVKCNAAEASAFVRAHLATDEEYVSAGADIQQRLGRGTSVVITRGADGLTILSADSSPLHLPAPHVEDVYDTVGAGDTVVAIFALALAARATLHDAGRLAMIAAGIVIRKVGNYAPTPTELHEAIGAQSR
jgi:rfaE bifunctional protein kinase chain/domain